MEKKIGSRSKQPREAKLEFSFVHYNDKDFFLKVKNCENKLTAKNVKIIWKELKVDEGFSNEPVILFENWRRDLRALEWKGITSDAIDISKNETKEAYIFEVNENKEEFYLKAFGCRPLALPKEDCTLYLYAHADVRGKTARFSLIVDLGKYRNRIIVNRVFAKWQG